MTLPHIDYTAWRFWFDMIQTAVSLAVVVYVWWSNREKVTNKRFSTLENRLKDFESGLKAVETAVKNPPACPHHNDFERRIDAVHGDVREIKGAMKGMNRAVDLMNEYLINRGK